MTLYKRDLIVYNMSDHDKHVDVGIKMADSDSSSFSRMDGAASFTRMGYFVSLRPSPCIPHYGVVSNLVNTLGIARVAYGEASVVRY